MSCEASSEDIKRAYRELAKRFHPDGASGDESRFREIREAYDTLADPEARRNYDREFPDGGPAVSWGGGFEGPLPPLPGALRAFVNLPEPRVNLIVSPDEARRGGSVSLEVRISEPCAGCGSGTQALAPWCPHCQGRGRTERFQRASFSVPAGAAQGQSVVGTTIDGREIRANVQIVKR